MRFWVDVRLSIVGGDSLDGFCGLLAPSCSFPRRYRKMLAPQLVVITIFYRHPVVCGQQPGVKNTPRYGLHSNVECALRPGWISWLFLGRFCFLAGSGVGVGGVDRYGQLVAGGLLLLPARTYGRGEEQETARPQKRTLSRFLPSERKALIFFC